MPSRWPKFAIGTLAALGVASVSASLTFTGAAAEPRYNSATDYNGFEGNHTYDGHDMVVTNSGNNGAFEDYNSYDVYRGNEVLANMIANLKPDHPWDAPPPK